MSELKESLSESKHSYADYLNSIKTQNSKQINLNESSISGIEEAISSFYDQIKSMESDKSSMQDAIKQLSVDNETLDSIIALL